MPELLDSRVKTLKERIELLEDSKKKTDVELDSLKNDLIWLSRTIGESLPSETRIEKEPNSRMEKR